MPFVHLRRGAPEVQNAAVACSICGTHDADRVRDHLLVGTPGTPSHDGGVCESCGRVLEQVVARMGPELSVRVEHAQHEASERDAPGMARGRLRRAARPVRRADKPGRVGRAPVQVEP
jgi:hypothetical protein